MGSIYLLQAAQCRNGEQWFHINWSHCSRSVRSLQKRVVKSVRDGAWRKVKRLCCKSSFNYLKEKHVTGASNDLGVSHA